ncbi:hypothetical protein [Halarcobacter ebronensis]|uniref:Uncharacterized protein n=1 Tax=Halarcobacter ebronensis TaxID=1462615 RepID=A0A4Q1AQY5_9BACT|nr:hypothetical protein [Halarcobacter ebronensis]QKF83185.1 hypothetical protein AEBR_2729 [Halarcobacter ebronensis]RXK05177.1 hypothetical protein CRV07_09185 [Halarcobacter ebronensis]
MERGNRSIEALKELTYINSLESQERADALVRWSKKYLVSSDITSGLDFDNLKKLKELFYTNINFIKEHKENTRKQMVENRKLKKFFSS